MHNMSSRPPPHCVPPYCYSQIDERFRSDQQNLEQTIVELIRARIRDRTARHERADVDDRRRNCRRLSGGVGGISRTNNRPRKIGQAFATASAVTIDSLVRSQTRPGASLAAADWQAVVRYTYRGAPADAQTVGVLVREAAMSQNRGGQGVGAGAGAGAGRGRQGRAGSRGRPVSFGVFLQVLLGYQLHGHLRCLRNFKEDFRKASRLGQMFRGHCRFTTMFVATVRSCLCLLLSLQLAEAPSTAVSSRNWALG